MKELVEDLKIANDNLYCANKMLEKEIERLNNIINELKKWLNYEYKHIRKNINFKEVLKKLQELKGEDKE